MLRASFSPLKISVSPKARALQICGRPCPGLPEPKRYAESWPFSFALGDFEPLLYLESFPLCPCFGGFWAIALPTFEVQV